MDNQADIKTNTNLPNSGSKRVGVWIVSSIVFVVTLAFIGYILGSRIGSSVMPSQNEVKEVVGRAEVGEFVIPEDRLSNPIFSSWAANIKGRIKSINQEEMIVTTVIESFEAGSSTITDVENGDELTIKLMDNRAQFIKFVDQGSGNFTRTIVDRNSISAGMLIQHGRVEIEKIGDKTQLVAALITLR